VLPPLQPRQNRNVVGGQLVLAGPERIAELPEIHELHGLRFANDELGAAFDRAVAIGEAKRQRIARVIHPLDDLDELAAEKLSETHAAPAGAPAVRTRPDREIIRRMLRFL